MRPGFDGQGGPSVACVVSECCYSSSCVVCEELEVEEGAAALWEAGENILPAVLAFEAMCELDVGVFECEFVFRELFQADDNVVVGSFCPATFRDEGCADSFEFGVLEDPLWAALDIDCIARIDKLLCGGRCDWVLLAVKEMHWVGNVTGRAML